MRSIIFALFLTICCIVVYTNAAVLPEDPAESTDEVAPPQFNDFNEDEDTSDIAGEDNDGGIVEGKQDPQSRTLFLLLPLLFPDQFYF